MSEEETIEHRQNEEFVVLQSIYFDNIKDLRKTSAWNNWKPLELSLLLTPPQGSSDSGEVDTQVELHIYCSDKYPDVPPSITFENPRGISHLVLNKFKQELELKARELCGEVMIHELAEAVRAFLDEHKKPASKSCYEEMQLKKHQREQDEQERQRLESDRKRQTLLDEIQKMQEIQKLEPKRRREQRLSLESSSWESRDSENIMRRNNSSEISDETFSCHQNTEIIEFCTTVVQRGSCINHNKPNRIIYSGMSTDNGKLYTIIEWSIDFKTLDSVQRQITNIEKEFNYLVKLRHHNLLHYLDFNYNFQKDENKVIVHILQEFVNGVNVKNMYLLNNIPVEMEMLKHIAEGVLCALDYLHRNNVIHRDISSSSVNISRLGVIHLANYSLDTRLSDLTTGGNSTTSHSKKTDIYKFGLLILSLIQGCDIGENYDLPTKISKDLRDFLEKTLNKEEKERHSASQLLNHPFIKVPLIKFNPNGNGEDNLPDDRCASPDLPSNDVEISDIKMLAHLDTNGESRAKKEFKNLGDLGKGAYGAVFKVQNRLDQRIYALKRITLDPKKKQLNKKIIREVKLLSRLNHENVVRYYYSWIETGVSMDESSSSDVTTISSAIKKENDTKNNDDFLDEKMKNIELLAPPMKNTEWIAVSYGSKSKVNNVDESSSSSSDEYSDDDGDWTGAGTIDEDDDYVKFEDSKIEDEKTLDGVDSIKPDTPIIKEIIKECQYMYIQMEFCEKSTLRTAIDGDLHLDNNRVWRLFREIIEGLSHIHLQGMIHRDLKPLNIFLDKKDHVKIGDFGLATNLLTKPSESLATNKSYNDYGSTDACADPSMTGHIGTALYVAPEISSTPKAVYNQKVDIYSLGIIFFEMCYKPLKTTMERCQVLTQIRSEQINFPTEFQDKNNNKEHIIRWLLDHNVSKRPTAQELLQSDKLPPPVWEDSEMQKLLKNTLSNSQLKSYKYLIEACFKQPVKPAQDITYDKDISAQNLTKNLHVYNKTKALIAKVFEIHGGQNLSTPLLMPKSKYYEGTDTCVKLMTHSGSIVSIPHDLRVPFARYVAWNGITSLRRYSIERVYREKKVFGFIPRELYECAFDIVTSAPGNLMADAEILKILNEIINIVPGFKNKNLRLKLNHTNLLKAIFLHNGIKDDMHNDLFCLLSDVREGKIKQDHLHTQLINKRLPDSLIQTLFNCLEMESPIAKLEPFMNYITKRVNSEASKCARQAIKELKTIVQNASAFEIELDIVITPGLVYNMQQYSGMICQLVCDIKKKHRQGIEVIAAGGRYDGMVENFRNMLVQADMSKDIKQSAVGVSISLDKLVSAMEKSDLCEQKVDCLDVVICSLGVNNMVKEKCDVLKSLWNAGIRCCVVDADNLHVLQHQCQELNVQHAVVVKDTDFKLFSWEKERMQEKRFSQTEVVEVVQKLLKSCTESNNEQSYAYNALNRSESKVSHTDHPQEANVVISYIEKPPTNTRKKIETQIYQQLSHVFKKLVGDVVCYPVKLDGSLIKVIAAQLDWDSDHGFKKSVDGIMERNQKHKNTLEEICENIYENKKNKCNPVVILYSLNDSFFRVLM